eukprot:TRINITY_DN9344_c0_g1_i1.p1 TRINITY_DN9344_c0_g1~~TRINITY_DN9344_c0_g1_i1.p1  ORF type:complete len:180 (+),score=19.19 TRINITY_DN9344_c0_g1_i1:63-542(+)
MEGDEEAVKSYLQAGKKVDTKKSDGTTPLIYAAANGQTRICELLLAAGANVNHKSQHGFTALMAAAGDGSAEITQLLLKHGADAMARNRIGQTAIDIARDSDRQDISSYIERCIAPPDLARRASARPSVVDLSATQQSERDLRTSRPSLAMRRPMSTRY